MTEFESQLLLLILFVLARLFSLYRPTPMQAQSLYAALAIQVLGSGVLFYFARWTLLPSIVLLTLHLADFYFSRSRLRAELLCLLTLSLGAFCVCCIPFREFMATPTGQGFFPVQPLKLILGWMLCLNEANLLVRLIIAKTDVSPVGEEEYNTGRKIGLLERTAAYGLVAMGELTAIGFIIGAKGLARFKEFENRTFAEYFLIGTLASVIIAVGAALAMKAG